jgi:hypothetical protein
MNDREDKKPQSRIELRIRRIHGSQSKIGRKKEELALKLLRLLRLCGKIFFAGKAVNVHS